MNTSNNTILDSFEALKKWLVKYSKIVLPVILVICVGLTIVIAIQANKRKVEQEEAAVAPEESTEGVQVEVSNVPLEKDAIPEINEMFNTFYTAMVEGDTDVMNELLAYPDAEEILRAKETSKHLESFSQMEVYTKPGPRENTYIAYVYVDLKFYDYDKAVPGMRTYYVCTNEDGSYYINNNGIESDEVLQYIRELHLQGDVIDLNNKVAADYNNMVAEDGKLPDFLLALNDQIETNVLAALAHADEPEEVEEEEETSEETAGDEPEEVVTKVKTTDVVNIRTSDSEKADKLGKAVVGEEFELLEEKGNGWSKVRYNGSDAYIKSEFLEPSETQAVSEVEQPANDEPEQTVADTNTTGTVTVQETVKIRKGPSTDSDQIDTVYAGTKLDVIMKQADGWTKIKYKGQTAYVKSDYVK